MRILSVESVSKAFDEVQALEDVTFHVGEGEFFCIVGPTNAGKSTLLKTIAGLCRPDSGNVRIKGRLVDTLQPKDRRVSLQFQNMALFPMLTGFENIAFPLRAAGLPEAEIKVRVGEVADLLKIGHVLHRHPRTFSGGEQQRVAIGRAIAHRSDLLMLDEPLTNLDARIRIDVRIEFKSLHHEMGQTIIYVTHDQVEALSLSERVGVLHEGGFQQIGTPGEIYHRPTNRFVAQFLGAPPMNILRAGLRDENGALHLVVGGVGIPFSDVRSLDVYPRLPNRLGIGVRPESIQVAPESSGETPLSGEVFWVEKLGSKSVLDVQLGEETIKAVVPSDHPVHGEGTAWFGFTPLPHHLLDLETEKFLR